MHSHCVVTTLQPILLLARFSLERGSRITVGAQSIRDETALKAEQCFNFLCLLSWRFLLINLLWIYAIRWFFKKVSLRLFQMVLYISSRWCCVQCCLYAAVKCADSLVVVRPSAGQRLNRRAADGHWPGRWDSDQALLHMHSSSSQSVGRGKSLLLTT